MTAQNQKPSILFVEDDGMILQMMEVVLNQFGYHVIPATDAATALQAFALESKTVDLVITDYNMPDICGIELIKKLRSLRQDIPIILCSGSDLKEEEIN